jgi:transcriptional regulator with XRE-family HTH domain
MFVMRHPYALFKNIKQARIRAGLSQKELGKRLGISGKTVSAYETGRAIPPMPILASISAITKVDISELMGMNIQNGEAKLVKKLDQLIQELARLQNNMKVLGEKMDVLNENFKKKYENK